MQYGNQPIEGRWSNPGKLTAILAAGATAAAWFAAMRPMRLPLSTLATVAAMAVGGVIVITRCRIPAAAKGSLIFGVCASLLVLIATQDILGLRAVNTQVGDALAGADAGATQTSHPRSARPAFITVDDPAAAGAAIDAGRAVDARVDGGVSVTGTLSATGAGRERTYRLNWTLIRGDEREWCGVFTDTPRDIKPDFANFAERVADAADRSRGKPLTCI